MDDVDAFFNFSPGSEFKRKLVSAGATNGRVLTDRRIFPTQLNREKEGVEYAKQFQKAEQDQLAKAFNDIHMPNAFTDEMNKLEDIKPSIGCDSEGASSVTNHDDDEVFDKYVFNYIAPNLSIVSSRSAIMDAIRNNPVVVLQGSTGCGKSTQVPQFILDDAFTRRERCNIIVTQPRRIAARSIAARVCNEQKWELGTLVGYQVGLKTVSSEDTRVLFCTTGVLLEKLVRSKRMAEYTHIILDEVHERDQDMDFLFIVVRRLMATNSPHVKIILMSATIDAPRFANHFKLPRGGGDPKPAPIVNIEAKRTYEVSEFYLCQLHRLKIDSKVDIDNPGIEFGMYLAVQKLCIVFERIDIMDQYDVPADERTRPTILVFLPGILEIDTLFKMVNETAQMHKYHVFALHSSITFEEQQRVFRPAVKGVRNIILATNIAESSITIPDVKYVIDFCLTKNLCTNTATNLTSLSLEWASHNNCVQRAGRAGRVMNGRVYRMVPRHFYENLMQSNCMPEMLRSPLEQVVLKTKLLDMGPPHAILALAMDQPKLSDIKNTILVLKELGGLFRTCNDVLTENDGDLTFIGRVMSGLPIDIRVTRLILFGYCFSVLEECIIIGAGLNVKSIFTSLFQDPMQSYSKKLQWSDGSGSDLFAILRAYRTWCSNHHQNYFTNDSTEISWGRRYCLNIKSLKEMANLVAELTIRLKRLGITEFTGVHRVNWTPAEKSVILKCVIAGAFYPNYFLRSSHDEKADRDAFQQVGGRDPETTVFFSGFNNKYIGPLYTMDIKRFFEKCEIPKEKIRVSFDESNEKIFVTFKRNKELQDTADELVESVPGHVAAEVYKAVKMRKCQLKFELRVMNPSLAAELAEHHGLGRMELGAWVPKKKFMINAEMITLPRPRVKVVHGSIVNIESPNRFWFRSQEEKEMIENIFNELNNCGTDIEPFGSHTEVREGQILAAPYDGDYHRAKVMYSTRVETGILYQCNFIDFGIEMEVQFEKLRRFRGVSAKFADIPPRVFECRLAEVQPSSLNSERSIWTTDANHFFSGLVTDVIVEAEIYSVVNHVANVIIHAEHVNVNEALINEGLAQTSEENYMSKMDHAFRTRHQNMSKETNSNWLDDAMVEQLGVLDDDADLEAMQPSITQCSTRLKLAGPFSPLEAQIFGAVAASASKSVMVEPNSVNSVLINSCSNDNIETLLVAVTMTTTTGGGRLTARETTLMPNIVGFAPLMALIFCPYMEMLQDTQRTRYVSMLCGLGTSPIADRPMYEEHDLQISLNVDISTKDLELVNQIRFAMDSLLFTKPGEECPSVTEAQAKTSAHKIKNLIIQLLENDRLLMGVSGHERHTWGMTPAELHIQPKRVYHNRAMFPLHTGLAMTPTDAPERLAQLAEFKENCDKLHSLAKMDIPIVRSILCKLCQIDFENTPSIKIHLLSRLHRERQQQIGYSTDI